MRLLTSAIGVTNTYAVVYKCTGETPPTGVKALAKNGAAYANDTMTTADSSAVSTGGR